MPPIPRETFRCTDCGRYFDGHPYWTGEVAVAADDPAEPATVVQARLCPDCAGPFLTPDDPRDPRQTPRVGGDRVSA